MPKGKIDKIKLSQMLRAGKSVTEAAKYFSVTLGAISQAKKELNINVVKSVVLENAHRIVDKNLNAVQQLQNINEKAQALLDRATQESDHNIALKCMAEIRGQLNLQLDIFKTLYDAEAVQEFQQVVLETIGEVDNEVREGIIDALRSRSALRRSLAIDTKTFR